MEHAQSLIILKAVVSTKDVAGKLKRIKEDDDLKNKVVKQQDESKYFKINSLNYKKKLIKQLQKKRTHYRNNELKYLKNRWS